MAGRGRGVEDTPQIPLSEYRVGDAGYLLRTKPLAWYRSAGAP